MHTCYVKNAKPCITIPVFRMRPPNLLWRRLLVLALNLATVVAVGLWAGHLAGLAGWRVVDVALLCCVLLATPWIAIGFWNASIGLLLTHVLPRGIEAAAPFLKGALRAGAALQPHRDPHDTSQ